MSPARVRVEDLHGYDVLTAVEFAVQRVEEAYLNGYDSIEFRHGAADVAQPVETGRGRIKWELRQLYESGGLDRWCDRRRSWPKSASLLLAMRRNPQARAERWSSPPQRAHR